MIGSTRQISVWVFAEPVDMRKSYDSLSALVVSGLSRDVLSGDCFLFVGKDLRRAKVAVGRDRVVRLPEAAGARPVHGAMAKGARGADREVTAHDDE